MQDLGLVLLAGGAAAASLCRRYRARRHDLALGVLSQTSSSTPDPVDNPPTAHPPLPHSPSRATYLDTNTWTTY